MDVRKKLPASHIVEYTKAKKKAIIKKKLKKLQDVSKPPLTPLPRPLKSTIPTPSPIAPSETPTFSYAIIHATK